MVSETSRGFLFRTSTGLEFRSLNDRSENIKMQFRMQEAQTAILTRNIASITVEMDSFIISLDCNMKKHRFWIILKHFSWLIFCSLLQCNTSRQPRPEIWYSKVNIDGLDMVPWNSWQYQLFYRKFFYRYFITCLINERHMTIFESFRAFFCGEKI